MARIMVVDDDANTCAVLKDLFSSKGHGADAAFDPSHLATLLKKFRPDLLVMDMQMPGGGGPAAKKVVDADPALARVPIVFFSSMPIERMKEWFPEEPRFRYVRKGSPMEDILKAVRELLGPKA
ncbi:MAG: response regulator [Elusimicrobia bacterium]|nr:response regulator [Elusimicrobiota bacterium]